MTTYLSPDAGAKIVRLMIIGMIAFLVMVGYVFFQSYQGRADLIDSQRAGCERGKLDRKDNAAFQRAQATYITKVVLARSVEEDVKTAARDAKTTFTKTSTSLTKRSKINCEHAFPKAGLFP